MSEQADKTVYSHTLMILTSCHRPLSILGLFEHISKHTYQSNVVTSIQQHVGQYIHETQHSSTLNHQAHDYSRNQPFFHS
jgi:hypothetical protein